MTDYIQVPVEPTDEMGIAGCDAVYEMPNSTWLDHDEALACFKAMLAAAPAVQGEPVAWIIRHPRFCGKFTDDKKIAEHWESKKQGCTTPLFHRSQPAIDSFQIENALSRYESIRDAVGGCGDGSCLIKKPSGMATNGGCRCMRDYLKMQRMVRAAQDLFSDISELSGRACNDNK